MLEEPQGLGDGLHGAAEESVVEVETCPVESRAGRLVSGLCELLHQGLHSESEEEWAKRVTLLHTSL